MEACAQCGRVIGQSEMPFVHQQLVVCRDCHDRMNITSTPAATERFIVEPESHDRIEKSYLPGIFHFLAIVSFIAAFAVGANVGQKDAAAGWIVFTSGCLSGLLLLAIVRVLDCLTESVQQLRQIAGYLDSKR